MDYGAIDMYGGPDGGDLASAGSVLCGGALIYLVIVVLYLWLFYRIFQKTGMSGWLTLLNLIPGIGSVIVVFILALGDWPALKGGSQRMDYQPPAGGYTPPPPGE